MRFHSKADLFSLAPQRDTPEGPAYLEIPVLPFGTYEHQQYGTLDWTSAKFDRMIANFDQQVTGWAPSLGSDHAFYNPFAAEAPAFGWISNLYVKPDEGLYARVDLTDLGEEAIAQKRYRYISAEVADKWKTSTGSEFENVIEGATLTNRPWHDTMPGLFDARMRQLLVTPGQSVQVDTVQVETFSVALLARVPGSVSFNEIESQLRSLLRAEALVGSDDPYDYDCPMLCEVYPDFCIYRCGWSGPCYKRSYTVDGETVTLGSDTVEVEQVWVEATRAAMSAARQAVKQMSAQPGGERGRKGGLMNLTAYFRRLFGLGEAATDEDVAAEAGKRLAQPVITAERIEPLAEPLKLATEASDTLTLSAAEVQTLRAKAARADVAEAAETEARLALARKAAESMIAKQMSAGKLIPAQFDGKSLEDVPAEHPLMQFALTNPAGFTATFDSAKPQLDLTPGRGGLQPKGGFDAEGGGGKPKSFMALVGSLVAEDKLEYAEAFERAAEEHPELYEDYRKQANTAAGGRD